ncbi:MAG: MotA/TolQ/ExbB proton channel family protein [bacterium]
MTRAIVLCVMTLILSFSLAAAEDVREAARKAEEDRAEALRRAEEVEAGILADQDKLIAEVERLEAEERELEAEVDRLERQVADYELSLERLEEKWARRELDFKEISGNVRVVARDLETMLQQSPMTALEPGRLDLVQRLLEQGYFPDIDDISAMAEVFFSEMRLAGEVGIVEAEYVGRDGEDHAGTVLTLGRFTSAYREGGEIGFLNYSPAGRRFYAMSALPSRRVRGQIRNYIEGESDSAPIDLSGGAALRQITHKTSLTEQLRAGGPIVYPILAIAVAALVIVVNKIIFLGKVRRNTGKYMTRVNRLAAEGNWEECEAIVRRHKGEHSPVNHVIEAGLTARCEDRETQESILQEAILREIPRLERGLSPLAIFGAVAPLLGLLGTVTGMIETFRVITLFGTGDPKLMSGGISEALVTTELGLAVAIPIMLVHTFLQRRVDHIIGEMEEKAVSLTNIMQKDRRHNGSSLDLECAGEKERMAA